MTLRCHRVGCDRLFSGENGAWTAPFVGTSHRPDRSMPPHPCPVRKRLQNRTILGIRPLLVVSFVYLHAGPPALQPVVSCVWQRMLGPSYLSSRCLSLHVPGILCRPLPIPRSGTDGRARVTHPRIVSQGGARRLGRTVSHNGRCAYPWAAD